MSPLSPYQPIISFDHNMNNSSHEGRSLPNLKQDIHSDDLIETLHQFHQQQNDNEEIISPNNNLNNENDHDIHAGHENDNNHDNDHDHDEDHQQDHDPDQITDDELNNENNNSFIQKLQNDDIIVPISTNTQPNLQYPPNYQFNDNGSTINFLNSKLQKNQLKLNSINNQSSELYPALQFDSNFITTISESFSNSTISSFDSVPPTLTHSITNSFSNASLQMSPSQQQQTPMRLNRKHSISNIQTPLQLHTSNIPQYQTPLRKTPSLTPLRKNSHTRNKSRLSLDAKGSLILSTNLKSPAGVNPFYTPPSFISPRANNMDSPQLIDQIQTPFATPLRSMDKLNIPQHLLQRKDDSKQHKRFKSNEFQDLTKAADLSLQLAEKLMNSNNELINNELQQDLMEFNNTQQFDTISRSRSSVNLSNSLMSSPQDPPLHQHQQSLPQNIYKQFDKLNFIPEIQNQPYAPLVQFHDQDFIPLNPESNVEIIIENKKEKKQKNHQCPLCGGRFQRPEHVKRHMRSHSSEKPFMCGICNKRFNRNDNMKLHERKIHGLDKKSKSNEQLNEIDQNEN